MYKNQTFCVQSEIPRMTTTSTNTNRWKHPRRRSTMVLPRPILQHQQQHQEQQQVLLQQEDRVEIRPETIFVIRGGGGYRNGSESDYHKERKAQYPHSRKNRNSVSSTIDHSENHDSDTASYDNRPPKQGQNRIPKHRSKQNHSHRIHHRQTPKSKTSSTFLQTATQLAKSSLDVTSKVAMATFTTTGKAAYHFVTPKHVSRQEIYGVWRFDQVIVQEGEKTRDPSSSSTSKRSTTATTTTLYNTISCVANVEFTPKGDVVTYYKDKQFHSPFYFRERSWPKSCSIEFEAYAFQYSGGGGDEDERANVQDKEDTRRKKDPLRREESQERSIHKYYYKGYFRRKLADPSVIKIVGKIYRIHVKPRHNSRFQWSGFFHARGPKNSQNYGKGPRGEPGIEIGTFVARRRLSRSQVTSHVPSYEEGGGEDDDEEYQEDEYEDEYQEDYDNEEDENDTFKEKGEGEKERYVLEETYDADEEITDNEYEEEDDSSHM